MTLEQLLPRLIPALERAQLTYMITGSVASSAHGAPRSTRDLDIVIATTREQLLALLEQFPSSQYYADEEQAVQALANRSQFNIIDFATGWKVDFIIAEDSEYAQGAMRRREEIDIGGQFVEVASAEDVLIAKLRWAKLSGSERQRQDAVGVFKTQGNKLDLEYVEYWVRELQLGEEWKGIHEEI